MSKTASRKLSNLMDREVMDAFNLFDRNKDGKITSEEIKELITSLGGDAQCPHVQVSAFEDEEGDELYSNSIFLDFKGAREIGRVAGLRGREAVHVPVEGLQGEGGR